MTDIPASARPRQQDLPYDLERALSAVVSIRTQIPEDAMTARMLGTERAGHGVVIRESGLIATIGYLVTEAESIWIVDGTGKATAGHTVAYDQETGYGLIQALGRLELPALEMGSAADLSEGEAVVLAGSGGRSNAISARVQAKREFAGYWEYLLDEAIFTAPPHPTWGGAGLIGHDGTLRGIGSLFVQQVVSGGDAVDGNMIVPIDILQPILDELLTYGKTQKPPRPWLGMMTTEMDDALVVAGLVEGGPAERADVRVGDFVIGVGGEPVDELAYMFRRIWATGEAGVGIPLTLSRDGEMLDLTVKSVNRADLLKSPQLH
ncbi:MAG: PDZ domain-containing protein [Alphaproteobacteria bacterium]|nr:PDZ domain-containing protein [Alphaproteobacteria bacterium]